VGFNQKLTLQLISGQVGIGTSNPTNIFQVGDGASPARLRISNGVSDYSLIGTKDVDDTTNTRVVISGNSRGSPYNGNIDYVATSGHHLFYTGGSNERMRTSNDFNAISTGYIFAGVTTTGLRINGNDHGSTIYQNATSINVNRANIGFT
jgi:hypothetical protein